MATVIRHDDPTEMPAGEAVRGAVYTFNNMRTQGEDYVSNVRAEAAKIIQEANAEAASIRKKAHEAGEAAARQSIEKLLEEKLGKHLITLRPALDSLVSGLDTARDAWLAHWEKSAVSLSIAISERVIRRELENDPGIATEWVREALDLAAGSSEITVRLNPNDHKHLESQVSKLAASISRISDTTIVADEAITAGGCRVETKHGAVDQQLETQLARLEEELG